MARILIVDDDPRMLRLYSEILMKEGYDVVIASDGQQGFQHAVSRKPDLILLDVMMPAADGVETLESLSDHPATKGIPVIFLTALVKEDEAEPGAGTIGGRAYISKSSSRATFVARVREVVPPDAR